MINKTTLEESHQLDLEISPKKKREENWKNELPNVFKNAFQAYNWDFNISMETGICKVSKKRTSSKKFKDLFRSIFSRPFTQVKIIYDSI